MAKSKPLTKAERAWLTDLQELLNRCPSKRLGFYTIGDPSVSVYDKQQDDAINKLMDTGKYDFCGASAEVGAELSNVYFPGPVHSTAG